MLESTFKANQRKDFMKMGWIFIQHVAGAGVPKGWPDTECISPTGYHCWVEWKKDENAEKQPLQEYWIKKLNSMGHDAFFVNPQNVTEWREYVIRKSRELSETTRQ